MSIFPEIIKNENGRDRNDCFLCLEHLFKSYQEGSHDRMVLQDASVSINRGEFVAIVGKSGSGKSTLLNLISGIDRADSGHIYLDGRELTGMHERERTIFRRRSIGFIFQFFNLIQTLTVLENVTLPLELNGESSAAARRRALPLLEAVGLTDRLDTFPDRLSGGEQQRIALARALVHDPGLVLADEPTGNLDEETGWQVLKLLDRLTRKSGKNLIIVTHNREAARYADRVLCLRDGKLTEQCDS